MESIEQFLLEFLEERGVDTSPAELMDQNLAQEQILDSFGMITLFAAIEDEYGIQITPVDMLDEDNKTLSGLARFIAGRQK